MRSSAKHPWWCGCHVCVEAKWQRKVAAITSASEYVPTPRKVPHGSEAAPCMCDECWNAGVHLMDREKQRKLDEL